MLEPKFIRRAHFDILTSKETGLKKGWRKGHQMIYFLLIDYSIFYSFHF